MPVYDVASDLTGESRSNAATQEAEHIARTELLDCMIDQRRIDFCKRLVVFEYYVRGVFSLTYRPVVGRQIEAGPRVQPWIDSFGQGIQESAPPSGGQAVQNCLCFGRSSILVKQFSRRS